METLLRVTRGHADAEELAAIAVVLLTALAPGRDEDDTDEFPADAPNWKRPERRASYQAPHSWR